MEFTIILIEIESANSVRRIFLDSSVKMLTEILNKLDED